MSSNRYIYINSDKKYIGRKISFKNDKKEVIYYFDTILRKYNSVKVYHMHLSPQIPYMNYGMEYITDEKKDVYFNEDEDGVNSILEFYRNRTLYLASPFGNEHLDKADFSELDHRKITVEWNGNPLKESYLKSLYKETNKYGISLFFDNKKFPFGNSVFSYDKINNADEFIIREPISIQVKNNNLFKEGEKISSDCVEKETILSPIIEAGRVIWIYSRQGLGKTHIALNIAYAVRKGHITVGKWTSNSPHKVMYVHGEMETSDIKNICDKMMIANGDTPDESLPFAIYTFNGTSGKQNSIIEDTDFLNLDKSTYKLIIFDSFYSLFYKYTNISDISDFIKKITVNDTAVMIIDHANSDGNLQGSTDKSKFADLIIKIEENNKIFTIRYDKDRYGYESLCPPFEFTTTTEKYYFKINLIEKNVDNISLCEKDMLLLYCYILINNFKVKQVELAKIIDKDKQRISEYMISVKEQLSGKDVQRNKIQDTDLFKKELEKATPLSKNEIIDKIKELVDTNPQM